MDDDDKIFLSFSDLAEADGSRLEVRCYFLARNLALGGGVAGPTGEDERVFVQQRRTMYFHEAIEICKTVVHGRGELRFPDDLAQADAYWMWRWMEMSNCYSGPINSVTENMFADLLAAVIRYTFFAPLPDPSLVSPRIGSNKRVGLICEKVFEVAQVRANGSSCAIFTADVGRQAAPTEADTTDETADEFMNEADESDGSEDLLLACQGPEPRPPSAKRSRSR